MIKEEKLLKRFLKKRVGVTLGLVVSFLITGTVAQGAIGAFNKDYTVGSNENKTISEKEWNVDSTSETWGQKTQYAVTAHHGGVFNINSEVVKINHIVNGEDATDKAISAVESIGGGKTYFKNNDLNINVSTDTGVATGIEVYDLDEKDKGSIVDIDTKNLIITSHSDNLNAFGIKTGSSTRDASESQVNIKSDRVVIDVTSTNGLDYGLAAYNGGSIKIDSKYLEINSSRAIDIRGNSYIGVNEKNSSENTVILNGDIQFTNIPTNPGSTSEMTEGKGLVLNLANSASKLNGNIIAGTTAEGKDIIRVGISNGANWNMTGGSSLSGTVTLQGGTINLGANGGLTTSGNGLVMNGIREGYNSTITGKGNINSNISVNNQGNIFDLTEDSIVTGKLDLANGATLENQGYLSLGRGSQLNLSENSNLIGDLTVSGTTIVGSGNINGKVSVTGNNTIFNLTNKGNISNGIVLGDKATAENQGYLAINNNSNIVVGNGATFTNKDGATIKVISNNTKAIEVNGGNAINQGTIDLTGTSGSYAMYATGNNSTLTNQGTINLDYNNGNGSKVFGATEGITSNNNNAGIIIINGIDGKNTNLSSKDITDYLFGNNYSNTGIIKDENGTVLDKKIDNDITFIDRDGNTLGNTVEEILGNMNISKEYLTMHGDKTLNADKTVLSGEKVKSFNIYEGTLTLNKSEISDEIKFDGVSVNLGEQNINKETNIADPGIKLGSGLTFTLANGTINGNEGKLAVDFVDNNSTLNLVGSTVTGDLGQGTGRVTTSGKTNVNGNVNVDFVSLNTELNVKGNINTTNLEGVGVLKIEGENNKLITSSITGGVDNQLLINGNVENKDINSALTLNKKVKFENGTISSGAIAIAKESEGYFSANSSFTQDTVIDGEGTSIFEVGAGKENAITNSNGQNIDVNTDFGFDTSKVTDENLEIEFGTGIFNGEYVQYGDEAYGQYFDKESGKLTVTFNKHLLDEYGANYSNIYNSLRLVRDKYNGKLDTKEENLALVDKIYTGTIYADTVRMAYDNSKLAETELLKINPEVATGEWVANGRALYMKNEYNREGIVTNYRTEKESAGLLASLEYGLNDTTNLGFAFAGMNNDIDTDTGESDGQAFYLGVFAKKDIGNYRLTAGLGYEFNRFDTEEKIFGGSEKYNSNVYSAYVEGRYSKDLGDNVTFEPKVKLGYTYVDQDSIQDGAYKLDSQDISIFDTEIGADLVKTVALKDGRLDVVFGASYTMAFGDTDDDFEGRFYNSKELGAKFNMMGANVAERSANFGLGLGVTKDSGMFYNGGVTFKAGSDNYRDYGITLGAGYKF